MDRLDHGLRMPFDDQLQSRRELLRRLGRYSMAAAAALAGPSLLLTEGCVPGPTPDDGAFSITGKVTRESDGAGIQGATIAADDGARHTATATSGEDGAYSLSLAAAGTYILTPSVAGCVCSPATRSVALTAQATSATGVDFVASSAAYTIAGRITETEGSTGIEGVAVHATPEAEATGSALRDALRAMGSAVTDADGAYSLGVAAGGAYVVTPSLSGYTFDPVSRTVTVDDATPAVENVDFATTPPPYSISGTVKDAAGSPLAEVTIRADATEESFEARTKADGTYIMRFATAGGYDMTALLGGYLFEPVMDYAEVNDATPDAPNMDFTGTLAPYSIGGTVTDLTTGDGVADVTVDAFDTAGNEGQAVTSEDGTYWVPLPAIAEGQPFEVRPALTGYRFDPEMRSVEVTTAQPHQTGVDFSGEQPKYSISGKVTNTADQTPVAGVSIAVEPEGPSSSEWVNALGVAARATTTATTGQDGSYTARLFDPGTYTVTPTYSGYTFDPTSKSASVSDGTPATVDVDFAGTAVPYGDYSDHSDYSDYSDYSDSYSDYAVYSDYSDWANGGWSDYGWSNGY